MSKNISLSLITPAIIVLLFLLSFGIAFAAADDVTLTTDTVISVGGVSINITGSSATLETIVVSASSFSVTLLSTSTISMSSGSRRTLATSVAASDYVSSTCGPSTSTLSIIWDPAWSTSRTITITPSSAACSTAASTTGGSSGGGGGGFTAAATVTTPGPGTTTVVLGSAVGLTISQAQSILDLLSAFDTEQSVIDNIRAIFSGTSTTGTSSGTASVAGVSGAFTVAYQKGQSSPSVKRLQQLLNSDSDTALATSGVGSSGSETNYYGSLTEKAIQKFQAKYGIVSSGTPASTGYGRLGPKTRAKLLGLFGN